MQHTKCNQLALFYHLSPFSGGAHSLPLFMVIQCRPYKNGHIKKKKEGKDRGGWNNESESSAIERYTSIDAECSTNVFNCYLNQKRDEKGNQQKRTRVSLRDFPLPVRPDGIHNRKQSLKKKKEKKMGPTWKFF